MIPPIPARPALFLDVDGTLLDVRPHPEDVRADDALRARLLALAAALDGAVAIVSGRAIEGVDRVLAPLRLPVAGLHGLERRDVAGATVRLDVGRASLRAAARHLREFVAANPPLWLEDKGGALAVHVREAPALESLVEREMLMLASRTGGELHVQRGLLVRELKPCAANKGTALHAFMREPPFLGRVPVSIGDDVTDLDMFRAARELGGFGVSIGNRVEAEGRLSDTAALAAWLETVVARTL